MNIAMHLVILSLFVSFSAGSSFIGLPESNWTTSSQMCSLAGIDNINNIDIFNESSDYMGINKVKKAWTGTTVKYTKWAAFIACVPLILTSIKTTQYLKTIFYCFNIKSHKHNSAVQAIMSKYPETYIKKQKNDHILWRCTKRNKTVNCPATVIQDGDNYKPGMKQHVHPAEPGSVIAVMIKKESSTCSCLSDKPETYDDINDCRATCTHPSNTPCQYGQSALVFAFVEAVLSTKSWYEYQEECLKEGIFVLYDRNTLGSYAHSNEIYWTPIFRSHTMSSEMESSKNGSESDITHHPLMALLISVIIAAALLIILLIFMMIMISSRTLGRLRFYKEKLQKVNERLQGTEFSEYTGLEEINVEENESGYRELSPNMQQLSTERHAHTPRNQLDHQGYLVPEQHYQTIQENLHYAETGITQNTSMVPVN
ncbi:unnamed protein product [Mytilus coruscus]|uniref:FLYWCH-type domain-containing protein n=1 Tax=Mytilus coruscus TaxID=42192 RepID=A0A6J8DKF2_MYTCO|nr:unnamed protein product [Mytilus coruscus]